MGELTALLRGIYEARDPEEAIAALLAASDPEVELWPAGLWLDSSTVVRGHEELAASSGASRTPSASSTSSPSASRSGGAR